MKYATLLLGLAIALASIIAARAEPIVCGDTKGGYTLQTTSGQIEGDPSEITFKAWGKVPRTIRINFVWDTKTNSGSLNGKPCYSAGGM